MRWVFLTVAILILLPFFTYLLSKMQMLGWLSGMRSLLLRLQEEIEEEKRNVKEEKPSGK